MCGDVTAACAPASGSAEEEEDAATRGTAEEAEGGSRAVSATELALLLALARRPEEWRRDSSAAVSYARATRVSRSTLELELVDWWRPVVEAAMDKREAFLATVGAI